MRARNRVTAIGFAGLLALLAAGTTAPASAATIAPATATSTAATTATTTTAAPDDELITVPFAPDTDTVLPNPERGLNTVVSSLQTITQAAIDDATSQHFTLIRSYVDLASYVGVDELPPELFTQLDASFALLRANGVKAILRFSYSPGGAPECTDTEGGGQQPARPTDAPLGTILRHIEQVAPTVAANADVISSIEAGFLGEFGEWHCSTFNRVDPGELHSALTKDAMREVVEQELASFPADLQIAVRYPRDIDYLQSVPQIAQSDRLGSHQDCYASNEFDSDTWDSATMDGEKQMIGSLGVDHVVAGVACNGGTGTRVTCTDTAPTAGVEPGNPAEMAAMHFSYLGGDFEKTAIADYVAGGCWDEITQSLGYRLQFTGVALPASVEPGGTAAISIAFDNVGWASPFNDRPVFFTLTSDDGTVTALPLDADPRTWKSGESVAIDQEVAIPTDLEPGEYTPGLWLPDRSPSLRSSSAYAIRFANVGTWDADTGVNVFPAVVSVGAAPTETPPTASPPTPPAPAPSTSGRGSAALAATGTAVPPLALGAAAAVSALIAGTALMAFTRRLPSRRRSG